MFQMRECGTPDCVESEFIKDNFFRQPYYWCEVFTSFVND